MNKIRELFKKLTYVSPYEVDRQAGHVNQIVLSKDEGLVADMRVARKVLPRGEMSALCQWVDCTGLECDNCPLKHVKPIGAEPREILQQVRNRIGDCRAVLTLEQEKEESQ
tara:strand:- start:889 stop:1221 length:333 start_codon:yes stop_codon:yes gene_type:complete